MIKGWKKAAAAALLACTFVMPGIAEAEDMMMPGYDGKNAESVMKDNMELVPLRQAAESLGFKVAWNDQSRSVTLSKMIDDTSMQEKSMDDKTEGSMEEKDKGESMMPMTYMLTITIDSKTMMIGNRELMLSYAPVIMNDMTYVSKDFVDSFLLNGMMK